jgi:hypothetical protein
MSYRTFLIAIGLCCFATAAWACPFCNAMKPTLAQQRESAQAAFIGEALDTPSGEHAGSQSLKVHRALKGLDHIPAGPLRLAADVPIKEGSLALLIGTIRAEKSFTPENGQRTTGIHDLQWTATPLDEAAVAYVASAPNFRQSSAKRLAFFSRFLEHRNPLIADDAYQEFAHATYDQTAAAADTLSQSQLRRWFVDPQVPPQRKGLYALFLGLAKDKADREANQKLLRARIVANESDFRAGFDGILAGYLLLGGGSALDDVESRYLTDPKAADGDVRSALKALRFYHDYGHDIPPDRIAAAEERVLARPEFAAEAITDLARWQDWRIVKRIAALYERKEYSDPFVRRAIVGYLKACPELAAATALDHLRQHDPTGVADAEKELSALLGR